MNYYRLCIVFATITILLIVVSCGLYRIGQSPRTIWHNATSAYGMTTPIEPNQHDILIIGLAYRATHVYLDAHNDYYPVATHWEEAIKPYWNKNFPFSTTLTGNRRLAINCRLSGASYYRADINDDTILFYETKTTHEDANGIPPHIPLRQERGIVPVMITTGGYSVNE